MVGQLAVSPNLSYFPFGKRDEVMNKCIVRKTQANEGVIKISHYYMNEIIRLCLYTIKNEKADTLQEVRAKKILQRVEKYLIQTGKKREFIENYKGKETRGVLPV